MKLFLLEQSENNGYDTFDSCVVCAENEEDARNIMPDFSSGKEFTPSNMYGAWAYTIEGVEVKYLGEAEPSLEKGIIIASFNAG